MTEAVIEAVSPVPEAFRRQHKAGPRRRRALKDGMPRRHQDARSRHARRYRALYQAITEAHPPKHRWGRWLASMLADLAYDYENLRLNKRRGARLQRRKTMGLIFGALREVKAASGHAAADDLALELAKLAETPR